MTGTVNPRIEAAIRSIDYAASPDPRGVLAPHLARDPLARLLVQDAKVLADELRRVTGIPA